MISPVEFISRSRDGQAQSEADIHHFISGITDGSVELHQAAAWLMAVRLNGMSRQETIWLTQAMINSGDTVDLSSIDGIPVDKHSTGGVGDTTTLVLAPIVAAAGAKVAKMSGRGLGHTGGTLDKMEAAGINVNLSSEQFLSQVRDIGVAVVGQTAKLVPADGILYSLRDITATIDSVPLIASSVMSKKLACGAQAILLDVKYGDGAFMPCLDSARDLAQLMVEIGKGLGRNVKAALSTMEQPLGTAIGNALEFREAVEVLNGTKADSSLARVSRQLATEMLILTNICPDSDSAKKKVEEILTSGAALEKLKALVTAQGGNAKVVDSPDLLPQAPIVLDVKATEAGYLKGLAASQLGLAGLHLGAGRLRKSDPIDPAVGVIVKKRIGDSVQIGDTLAQIHASNQASAQIASQSVLEAVSMSPEAIIAQPDIAEWVE